VIESAVLFWNVSIKRLLFIASKIELSLKLNYEISQYTDHHMTRPHKQANFTNMVSFLFLKSLTHTLTHSLNHSLTHSLTHSYTLEDCDSRALLYCGASVRCVLVIKALELIVMGV